MSKWDEMPIGSICDVGDGAHAKVERTTEGVPYLTSKNFGKGFLKLDKVDFISHNDFEKLFSKKSNAIRRPQTDDVLMGIIGTFGNGYKYKESDFFGISSSVAILRPNKSKIDADFLQYVINSEEFALRHKSYSGGSIQGYSNIPTIKNIPIKVPPIQIQKKIVKVLSALDNKIELNNRINTELENLAKTIYDYWFVQFDFPDKNGKPYKASGGKMVYNQELKRSIPKGWEVGTLFDLGDIVGGSTPSTQNPLNFCNNGIPWITPKDLSENLGNKFISKGKLDVTEIGIKEASLKIYPKGSVLLSSRAPIGYMAISRNEFTTNQGFKSFITNKEFSSYFVYYTIQNSLKTITQYATGSTFKEISATTLKSIQVCLPNKNICDIFTDKVDSIFKQQNILELENQQLTELRDWLLPMLMNGQVTVK